ncbi:hypothetical protein DFR30_2333 [Thiogranum longum]|uniref:DUF6817 domain-containing protein n=1 Tax=Thiogranum longum TaxID=1537524 RepID=A0A4R1HFM7_9GAMM|nr:hypothetical protein [Thiogranum longum]TCK19040.1 hypothetical protein DFR30_2333 [Thiogranum longum]
MSYTDLSLTYPQFVIQCVNHGYDNASLRKVRDAYEFMEEMSDGLFRAQGAPFSCHLLRTASIVLSTGAALPVVLAAMVHSAYRLRLFKNSRRRAYRLSHRSHLQTILGSDVEMLVYAYAHLPWYSPDTLDQHLANLESATQSTRNVLTIRLADELEDWLDLSLAFMDRDQVACRIEAYGSLCIRLAERMELEGLANSMRDAAAQYRNMELPDVALMHRHRAYERSRAHLWEMSAPEAWLLNFARRVVLALRSKDTSRRAGKRRSPSARS